MILVFDLDDTLYPEFTFVESGFTAVSRWLQASRGWPEQDSYAHLCQALARDGRGAVFDDLLRSHQQHTRSLVAQCLSVYRNHAPAIKMYPGAAATLKYFDVPKYVVTDGNKIVQSNKIRALQLHRWFKHCYPTHQYGVKHAKPSTYCFELIRKKEACNWSQLLYVGDNPAKDFVGLNGKGAHTVRVLTGRHGKIPADYPQNAQHIIPALKDLPLLLNRTGELL